MNARHLKTMHRLRRLWASKPRQTAFWSNTMRNGECLIWAGHVNKDGYGVQGDLLAHRVAYFLGHGHLDLDSHVLHKCDNPRCVNPAHLFLGTHADNMADMASKGRRKGVNTGEANGRAVLTMDRAKAIREDREAGLLLRELAKKYGVGISTVARVVTAQAWATGDGNGKK